MIIEILPKNRIENKDIWLSDTRNNGVGISSLEEADSNLYHDGVTEKGSTVDNNGIRYTCLSISDLRKISSSLYHKGYLSHYLGTFKIFLAWFYVESCILLW